MLWAPKMKFHSLLLLYRGRDRQKTQRQVSYGQVNPKLSAWLHATRGKWEHVFVVALCSRIQFNEHWPNSSHTANKLRFDKVWKFGLKIVFGALWMYSRPTWGPSVVDVQHRTEVLCGVHSRANRGSVCFSHSTFTAQTTAHTQPRKA